MTESVSRRNVLKVAGVGALALAAQPLVRTGVAAAAGTGPSAPVVTQNAGNWSDLFSIKETDVVIDGDVVLDVDAVVESMTITQNGRLIMAPDKSVTLSSLGNVEVHGELVMRPASAAVVHTVQFVYVNESKFKGGGMAILPSDVGLWITNHGKLNAVGAKKTPWTRATDSLARGATTIAVEDATGWRPGDRIAIAPTGVPSLDNGKFRQDIDNAVTYDEVEIASVTGNLVTVERELLHDHPTVSYTTWDGDDRTLGAEVLNLSRNVKITGSSGGRAHVLFLHCHHAQMVESVQFDQLGPRRAYKSRKKTRTDGVVGRYPFHMHHCGDGARGSIIKDCLVTRSGNRAFVPHESHGVTLEGCVAHDVRGTAYWWDQPGRHNPTGEFPETHGALWTGCVASKVWATTVSDDKYRLAGFNLSGGDDNTNTLVDSVAVGIYVDRVNDNNSKPSGFHWTEHGHSVWKFSGCLAHNVAGSGLLGWQNDEEVHLLEDFTAYRCGGHGIEHGAYSNLYQYNGANLIANRMSGIASHAVTRRTNSVRRRWTDKGLDAPDIIFENVRIDGQGITPHGIRGLSHKTAAKENGPMILENIQITGCTEAGLHEEKMKRASYYIMRNCHIDGKAFDIASKAAKNLRIDVYNLNGSGQAFTLRSTRKKSGTFVSDWNVRLTPIGE